VPCVYPSTQFHLELDFIRLFPRGLKMRGDGKLGKFMTFTGTGSMLDLTWRRGGDFQVPFFADFDIERLVASSCVESVKFYWWCDDAERFLCKDACEVEIGSWSHIIFKWAIKSTSHSHIDRRGKQSWTGSPQIPVLWILWIILCEWIYLIFMRPSSPPPQAQGQRLFFFSVLGSHYSPLIIITCFLWGRAGYHHLSSCFPFLLAHTPSI